MPDLFNYQRVVDAAGTVRPLARGHAGTITLTQTGGTTSGRTFTIRAGSTQGANDITGITVAAHGSDVTKLVVTVPASSTLQVVPPTSPAPKEYGPKPAAWIYCTVYDDALDDWVSMFAIPVVNAEGTES